MTSWTTDELTRIGAAEELEIAPRRRDGTLRKPVPIWVVRVDDDVHVRAAYGPGTGWHRVARASREGRLTAGGVQKDVTFEDAPRRSSSCRADSRSDERPRRVHGNATKSA